MIPLNPERLRSRRRETERRQARLASSQFRRELDRLIGEAQERCLPESAPDSSAIRMTMNRPFDPFSRDGRVYVEAPADPIPKTSQWWRPFAGMRWPKLF